MGVSAAVGAQVAAEAEGRPPVALAGLLLAGGLAGCRKQVSQAPRSGTGPGCSWVPVLNLLLSPVQGGLHPRGLFQGWGSQGQSLGDPVKARSWPLLSLLPPPDPLSWPLAPPCPGENVGFSVLTCPRPGVSGQLLPAVTVHCGH